MVMHSSNKIYKLGDVFENLDLIVSFSITRRVRLICVFILPDSQG